MILQRLLGLFFIGLLTLAIVSSASGKIIQDQDQLLYDDGIDFQNFEDQGVPEKRAYMRLGKRAYMRLGKRSYLRLGKRAPLRLG